MKNFVLQEPRQGPTRTRDCGDVRQRFGFGLLTSGMGALSLGLYETPSSPHNGGFKQMAGRVSSNAS